MTAKGGPASSAARAAFSPCAAFGPLARGAVALTTALSGLAAVAGLSGCAASRPPIRTEERVDLSRFMGDWYVLASIPTVFEKDIYDAVESYRLEEDGSIATTFTYRDGGPDGEQRSYHPRGFVVDPVSNAVWGMQFVWPVRADYRIVYVDDGYTTTIVGRDKRDYVWIMARTPSIPETDYRELVAIVDAEGYDVSELRRVPQSSREP